jgi:hypothetical protein
VEQPGQDFIRLEIRRDGKVTGNVVISIVEPDGVYRTRRAFVNEIVVDPNNDRDVWAALEATRTHATDRGADLLLFDLINPMLVRRALGFGFTRRAPTRVLLVATNEPALPAEALALDGANWLITRGDSDIDRPW